MAFSSVLNLSSLNGSNGFAFNTISPDNFTISASKAGDINGDGRNDLIIGDGAASPNNDKSGQGYVVFGSSNGFASNFYPSSFNGDKGFALNGTNSGDALGMSVSDLGDINGDGKNDLIISAGLADPNGRPDSGRSYVVFGSTNPFASSLNLSNLNGSNGFTINGLNPGDGLGRTVKGVGDINNDGRDDLFVGGEGAPNGNNLVKGYIIFGQDPAILGDDNNNLLNGTSNDDVILGLGGNDTLFGLAGNDSLDGGTGNDVLNGGIWNDTLNGGTGEDTYLLSNANDLVQETSTINSEIDTVESNISYTLGNNLENLILIGDDNLQGSGNNLNNRITGNIGDNIINGGNGYDTLSGGLGNDSFRFNSGVAFNTNLAVDRIVDFTNSSDKIVLSKTTFAAITSNLGTGFSNQGEFANVTSYAEAESSAAVIVYNTTNDRLFYNQNGTAAGFGTGAAFAELLGNPNLVASDFSIFA